MEILERVDGRPHAGMNDNFEKRQASTCGIGAQSQRGCCCEQAVHNIVWVWSEADEEKQFRALFDGSDDAFYGHGRGKPARDGFTEARTGNDEDG
jgi:hypothetical protein